MCIEGDREHLRGTAPLNLAGDPTRPKTVGNGLCKQYIMAKNNTTKAATQGAPAISPAIMAIYNSALGILSSKLPLDGQINRQVECSIIGNGVDLERGAWLYNTNVTTNTKLNGAIELLNPETFFAQATSEEAATELTRKALNAASISFSIPFGRGEKLSNGELIVAQVQEYTTKAGEVDLGLRFVRKEKAVALERSSSAVSKFAAMRVAAETADPFQD